MRLHTLLFLESERDYNMKKAIITILALVMILSAVSVSVSANTGTVSFDQIVKSACDIIRENEGYYYSVAANDNGALSIGWIQWHGNRALSLLRDIVIRDTATAKTILGDTLYDEIMTTSSWASRTRSARPSTSTGCASSARTSCPSPPAPAL